MQNNRRTQMRSVKRCTACGVLKFVQQDRTTCDACSPSETVQNEPINQPPAVMRPVVSPVDQLESLLTVPPPLSTRRARRMTPTQDRRQESVVAVEPAPPEPNRRTRRTRRTRPRPVIVDQIEEQNMWLGLVAHDIDLLRTIIPLIMEANSVWDDVISQSLRDTPIPPSSNRVSKTEFEQACKALQLEQCLPKAMIGDSCVVCCDQFEADSNVVVMPCNHAFHKPCIGQWLETNNVCPICRRTCITPSTEPQ